MNSNTTSFRTKVFNRAYQIKSNTNCSFADALRKAWALYRLAKRMNVEEVSFTYMKVDGSLRKAYGTLKNVGQFIRGTGKVNNKVFRYWDTEAAGFRCFRVENLVNVSI